MMLSPLNIFDGFRSEKQAFTVAFSQLHFFQRAICIIVKSERAIVFYRFSLFCPITI